MNPRTLLSALIISFSVLTHSFAQEPSGTIIQEMNTIVNKVKEKLGSGQSTAEALAPEIAEFDALLAKYPEKNEETAMVALMKATLYTQVLGDEETGKRLLTAIETDYPGTKAAANAKNALYSLTPEGKAKAAERNAAAKERRAKNDTEIAKLIGQPAPELQFKWSSKEGLKTLSDLKGRVVVLDFWATWCGPCISSFPQVRKHVEHFKNDAVTFLGVTSIQGRVSNMGPTINTRGDEAKETGLMPEFMELKNMTWDVVFTEERVFNPEYFISGIPHLVIIAPDGTYRHGGLHPGNPASNITGKVEALLKEFDLD